MLNLPASGDKDCLKNVILPDLVKHNKVGAMELEPTPQTLALMPCLYWLYYCRELPT